MKPIIKILFNSVLWISSISISSLWGCVSVKIKNNDEQAKKFEQIQLIAPGTPFTPSKKDMGDQAWLSLKTGNIISYLSSCNGEDPDLKTLEAESVSVLESGVLESSENMEFNHRQALLSHIQGKVDGIEVFLDILSFKKNNCFFTIHYTGKKAHHIAEQVIFSKFLDDFKVP